MYDGGTKPSPGSSSDLRVCIPALQLACFYNQVWGLRTGERGTALFSVCLNAVIPDDGSNQIRDSIDAAHNRDIRSLGIGIVRSTSAGLLVTCASTARLLENERFGVQPRHGRVFPY